MKILFSSYTFFPNVGGIESVSALLAERFAGAGHEVELITETPEKGKIDDPIKYRITRRSSLWKTLPLIAWCDMLFQNNISLRSLILALVLRRPAIVVHQTWLRSGKDRIGWNNHLKRVLLSRVTNVAISRAILDHIKVPARVMGNPYDDRVFRLLPDVPRDHTLVFLGRLVSDKGVDLLLRAMKILHADGLTPDVTIIGDGPEEQQLRRLVRVLGLDRQVTFAGQKSGDALAELLNRHRILVVPSRWAEPFGIVALEAIACGCVVVGSADGGLREAIGPCGVTFENGNEQALASCIKNLLLDAEKSTQLRKEASAHLAKFQPGAVASAYLELMKEVVA